MKHYLQCLNFFMLIHILINSSVSAQEGLSPLVINDLPAEFKELYEFHSRNIELNFADQKSVHIRLEANYNTVRLSDPKQVKELEEALESYQISPEIIDKVKKDLLIGIINTEQCQGIASSCLVSPATYATLFDYYTNKLYLWVNPDYIKYKSVSSEEYAISTKENYSFINHFSSYASSNDGLDNYSLSFYDDSIVGLPHGYIDNRMTYNANNNDYDFDLDRSQYNYEFGKYRFRAGYNATVDDYNSTDQLIDLNNTAELSFDFGTSSNLIKNQAKEIQKIFFFAPKSGVLKVYRDNRIILQRNVSGGQGYITNLDLPRGRYNIMLEITVGDQIVTQETHAIFNTTDNTLAVGDFDYRLTAGVFKETDIYDDDSIEGQIHHLMDNQAFGRLLMSYRMTDRILLSSGVTVSSEGNNLSLGSKLYLPLDATLDIKTTLFEDSAYQIESYFSWNSFSFNYEQYYNGIEDTEYFKNLNTLATYYYGVGNYKRYNVSYSNNLPFIDAYGYLSYSYTNQDTFSNAISDRVGGYNFEINSLSGGVRVPFVINSTLDFNMNYTFSNGVEDDYYASLTWSIPINQLFDARSTISSNKSGLSQFSNSIESSDLLQESTEYYLSGNVTNNYTPQSVKDSTYASSSLNAQVSKNSFNANAYIYDDTNGSSSTNLSFDSSQIVTKNGLSATNKRSDAYVRVVAENNVRESAKNSSKGLLVLEKNGRYANKQMLYDDNEVLPVNIYNDYQVSLDVESSDLYNLGDTRVGQFTQPGSVMELHTKISRVVTFVSGFKDIFDKEISDIKCNGNGCIDVKEMAEGVYKVSVLEGMSFSLSSGENNCFLPSQSDTSYFNFGNNLCLPDLAFTSSTPILVSGESMVLTYLGNYKSDRNFKDAEAEISTIIKNTSEIELIKKEIANTVFVYSLSKDGYRLSTDLNDKISDLQRYAIKRDESPIGGYYALQRQ